MRNKNSLLDLNHDLTHEAKIIPRENADGNSKGLVEDSCKVSGYITDEQLLEVYLSLTAKERHEMFADTARAAEIVGLSQRTIQLWIEVGLIRAFLLGGKYKICLNSLKRYLKSRIEQQAN